MSNAFVAPHFQSPETAGEWLEKRRCSWCAEKECRKDFTVTTGTVMDRSHIPLNKWLMAFYLFNASKKGMSAHQPHRPLNLDYKSAWFMCHRICEAMRRGALVRRRGCQLTIEKQHGPGRHRGPFLFCQSSTNPSCGMISQTRSTP